MVNKRGNILKKRERSKVKLKGKKTVLKKAENITDTTFKVRKIVVPQQLKSKDDEELLTRRKQSVKDLCSRLKHYNVSVKKDGLEGLKELFTLYPEELAGLHLAKLIEGSSQLILDFEHDIRREAINLLGIILKQVPELKLIPFSNLILNYLSCAMTHINVNIQNDALLMLDTVISSSPQLLAKNSNKILNNFLDMISSQRAHSAANRSLTINMGSKFTSITWRLKVLHRLEVLLSTILTHRLERSAIDNNKKASCSCLPNDVSHRWCKDTEVILPIHTQHYRRVCYLPAIFGRSGDGDGTFEDGSHLKNYAKVILPLLMEAWIEVNLSSSEKYDDHGLLSLEAGLLLASILIIIRQLLELLEILNLNSEIPDVIAAYKASFLQYILPGFPYSYADTVDKSALKKITPFLYKDLTDMNEKCEKQNLAICMLFCNFCNDSMNTEYCNIVVKYIKSCIENWKGENIDKKLLVQILKQIFEKCSIYRFEEDSTLEPLLDAVVACYLKSHDEDLLQVLSGVALSNDCAVLHSNKNLQMWLEYLPTLLCSSSITADAVKALSILSSRNNTYFHSSLYQKLPDILNNLSKITVRGKQNKNEQFKSIITILFWVKNWSPEAVKILSMHLQCEHWEKSLTAEIMNMLSLKNGLYPETGVEVTMAA